MTDKELNSIGQWLNSKGYGLDLTDCFWMEDWIANETKFRDIAELLSDYHKEQLPIHGVSQQRELLCEHKYRDIRYGTSRCVICGEEEQSF